MTEETEGEQEWPDHIQSIIDWAREQGRPGEFVHITVRDLLYLAGERETHGEGDKARVD